MLQETCPVRRPLTSAPCRLVALPLAMLLGCSNATEGTPKPEKVRVAETTVGSKVVELLTDDRLETGLAPIYLKVTDGEGNGISTSHITFKPMMAMSNGTGHSCPVLGEPSFDDEDGLYHTAVVFQMASSEMGQWSATVGVDAIESGIFEALPVVDSGRAQTFSYTDPTTSELHRYVSSLNFLGAPRVGLNPIVFTLHEMRDMMSFAPVEDASPSLDPQMTSMGHGSPGSVDPSHISLGRYEGQLSFSMPGTWETTVTIASKGATLGTPKFTTTF